MEIFEDVVGTEEPQTSQSHQNLYQTGPVAPFGMISEIEVSPLHHRF